MYWGNERLARPRPLPRLTVPGTCEEGPGNPVSQMDDRGDVLGTPDRAAVSLHHRCLVAFFRKSGSGVTVSHEEPRESTVRGASHPRADGNCLSPIPASP